MNLSNLARFDLVSIRLVVFCEETGTLAAAAKKSNMSISRASQRLSSLEAKLGTRLFERSCHGLDATPEGQLVATHGLALLATIASLSTQLFDPPPAGTYSENVRFATLECSALPPKFRLCDSELQKV